MIYFLNAEILDPEWTTKLFFDFDYEERRAKRLIERPGNKMFPKISEAGFETFNSVLNCGGISVILTGLFFLLLVQGIEKAIRLCHSYSRPHEGGAREKILNASRIACTKLKVVLT